MGFFYRAFIDTSVAVFAHPVVCVVFYSVFGVVHRILTRARYRFLLKRSLTVGDGEMFVYMYSFILHLHCSNWVLSILYFRT